MLNVFFIFMALSVFVCIILMYKIADTAIEKENFDFEMLECDLDIYKVECEKLEHQVRFWRMQAERFHYEIIFKSQHDDRKCALGCGTKTVFDYDVDI